MGVGSTIPVSVNYNSEFEKLIINPIPFTASNVEANQIDIIDHGFETGDKVFYDGSASGLSTGTYFVSKVSSRRFQLAETFADVNRDEVRTVSIVANTGGNQTIAPINPRINVVKNSKASNHYSGQSPEFEFRAPVRKSTLFQHVSCLWCFLSCFSPFGYSKHH